MAPTQRIVSLLPSATELIYELGLQNHLYGVTHECLYPDEAKSKPRVIDSVFSASELNSKEIDEKIKNLVKKGEELFSIDKKNLQNAKPDLIISQELCEVCSAYTNQVAKAVSFLENKPDVYTMNPSNLDEILISVRDLSKLLGKSKEGEDLIQKLENRIDFVKNQEYGFKPRVLCLEWISPFYSAGHWIPQMIEYAGGKNQLSKVTEKSKGLSNDVVYENNPELIILMPCGFDLNRTLNEFESFLNSSNKWGELSAVKNKKVFAVDANSYFSKPSIRTVTGLEILAKIIHPELFTNFSFPKNSVKRVYA